MFAVFEVFVEGERCVELGLVEKSLGVVDAKFLGIDFRQDVAKSRLGLNSGSRKIPWRLRLLRY